jgi:hypothetical protein
MEASILDLRYRMKEILNALDHRETVSIKYHGKIKGEIVPRGQETKRKNSAAHPMFGMLKDEAGSPAEIVAGMRRERNNGL